MPESGAMALMDALDEYHEIDGLKQSAFANRQSAILKP